MSVENEIFITGCTGSCHFDNFHCSQWWKFRQNDDISFFVLPRISIGWDNGFASTGDKPVPNPMILNFKAAFASPGFNVLNESFIIQCRVAVLSGGKPCTESIVRDFGVSYFSSSLICPIVFFRKPINVFEFFIISQYWSSSGEIILHWR